MRKVPATTRINFQKIIGHCQHYQNWRGAPIAKKYIIMGVPIESWRSACDGLGVDCKDAGLSVNIIVLTGNCKEIIIPIIAQGIRRKLRVWIQRNGHFCAQYLSEEFVAQKNSTIQEVKNVHRIAHREQCARMTAS